MMGVRGEVYLLPGGLGIKEERKKGRRKEERKRGFKERRVDSTRSSWRVGGFIFHLLYTCSPDLGRYLENPFLHSPVPPLGSFYSACLCHLDCYGSTKKKSNTCLCPRFKTLRTIVPITLTSWILDAFESHFDICLSIS